ncbi:MAG: alpha/beta hydrolase [Clostridia bacterium]|nr:alpha/beta hydrolase [Clostridia bacterium]
MIAFFNNLVSVPSAKNTPEDAFSVVYADTVWGDLKLFLPERIDPQKPTDVLLTIHGGAWVSGSAKIFYEDCRAAAKAGYIAASMNYSKIFNGASASDMVNEIGLAISAMKADLEARGIQPGKLIMAGHSAGAHIMLLYAYAEYKHCPMDIAFVVSNCAAADFLIDAEKRESMVGKAAYLLMSGLTKEIVLPSTLERNAEAIRAITPLRLITPDVPPTIVVQGTEDKLISYQNSVALFKALQENGVDSVHITYEGAGHFLSSKGGSDVKDKFAADDARRGAAFYAFAEKYCSR